MKGLVLASIAVALAACTFRPPPPAPPRRTNLELGITAGELPNGLRIVLVQDPRAAELRVTMRYQVGSIDDPPDRRGIAHLVEHLMFQQVLGADTLYAHLERSATEFNASTSPDATTYVARARTSQLDKLLSIEAVRVGFRCTTISESAFVREREVVLNELRQRDEAREIWAALHAAVYPAGHPYAAPMAGTVDSVAAITLEQACAFADAHYATSNAVLVISGDLKPDQVEAALGKFLAKVARRTFTPTTEVPRVAAAGRRVDATVPIERGVVMAAWPLPADPMLRTKLRVLASHVVADAVDERVRGSVGTIELGDERAPMLAVMVRPAEGEATDDVAKKLEEGVEAAPAMFARRSDYTRFRFDQVQQTALYQLYAAFEDGETRDAQLAAWLQAGRAPQGALAAEVAGLNAMTQGEAANLAREHFAMKKAVLVTLAPREKGGGDRSARIAPAIHDLGQRRDLPDPADAHRPAAAFAARSLAHMTARELPNGMKVVLLPLTSVPTVDLRLVFARGSADEPLDKRGAALVAAHALRWDVRYLKDRLLFSAAGGSTDVDVGTDHIAFGARGLDMHLDYLLAGLRRRVRDGIYEDTTAFLEALQRETKRTSDDGAVTDAWRAAVFGAAHPYARAGLPRHASASLAVDDVARFRRTHFTPDNATLVIAGRFDAALADRWIDFLFADWTGKGAARPAGRAMPQRASIAFDDDRPQVSARISLPAAAGGRPAQLVLAEMLGGVASDLRHQLGATYGMHVALREHRLAAAYELDGRIDAARAAEVADVLRTRIAALRTLDDATARAFVMARDRVLVRLNGLSGRAHELADLAQRDVELGRVPMSDLATAAAVQKLTLDELAPALAELDLDRAAILLTGPPAQVDAAFAALGRTAVRVAVTPAAAPPPREDRRSWSDARLPVLEAAITEQRPDSDFLLTASTGVALGRHSEERITGPAVAVSAGYRFDATTTIGVQLSLAHLTGTRDVGFVTPILRPFEVTPVELGMFVQLNRGPLWGQLYAGAELSRVLDNGMVSTTTGVGLGGAGGVDVVRRGRHRFGVGIGVALELLAASNYGAAGLNLTYRRF
ncbi:MAG: insulinase family protein [Deltaproteobacteria bacterium]|nr:insulinase family protein [Deltaproteobacteria bacterium]